MIKKLIVISLIYLTAILPLSANNCFRQTAYIDDIVATTSAEPEQIHPPYPGYRRQLPVEE